MNPPPPLANRKDELDLFQQVLTGQISKKIILIKAPEKFGKSYLLNHFMHECQYNFCILPIPVWLQGSERGIPFLLDSICEEIGQEKFPQFAACLTSMPNSKVSVDQNWNVFSKQAIEIYLNEDETLRDLQLHNLQKAFFKDLNTFPSKMVVLIDSFESAVPELQYWISDKLLREAVRIPQLIVVIAGREIPDSNNIIWGMHSQPIELSAIHDHKAWHEYAQRLNLPFSTIEEAIRLLIIVLEGHPGNIVNALNTGAKKW